jgi:hypothetical protein
MDFLKTLAQEEMTERDELLQHVRYVCTNYKNLEALSIQELRTLVILLTEDMVELLKARQNTRGPCYMLHELFYRMEFGENATNPLTGIFVTDRQRHQIVSAFFKLTEGSSYDTVAERGPSSPRSVADKEFDDDIDDELMESFVDMFSDRERGAPHTEFEELAKDLAEYDKMVKYDENALDQARYDEFFKENAQEKAWRKRDKAPAEEEQRVNERDLRDAFEEKNSAYESHTPHTKHTGRREKCKRNTPAEHASKGVYTK